MKEIFEIHQKDNVKGINCISARELYKRLGIKTQFSIWWRRNLTVGFKENIDFITVNQTRLTVRGNKTEYIDAFISLDMTKEICMLQRSDIGKQFRQYFIECEKRLKSIEADNQLGTNNSVKEIEEQPDSLEIKECIFYYRRKEFRAIKTKDGIWFRLSDIKPIINKWNLNIANFGIDESNIRKFHLQHNKGRDNIFVSLIGLIVILGKYPNLPFSHWFIFTFCKQFKKSGQKLLTSKEDNEIKTKIKEHFKHLNEEMKLKVYQIMKKYPALNFNDLKEIEDLLKRKHDETFYNEVTAFCEKKSVSVDTFLNISTKIYTQLLFVD